MRIPRRPFIRARPLAFTWTLVALALVGIARAQDLPRAQPEELGFSSERLAYLDQFFADKVKRGEMAGIVTLIARHGKIAHFSAIGAADLEARRAMAPNTIFRIYSMTKPITSVALMMLYEEGRFQMTDPVSKYLPQFAALRALRDPDGSLEDTVALTRPPTIQDLLRHTAGFSHGLGTDALDALYTRTSVLGEDVSLAEMMDRLAKLPLRFQPGSKLAYSVGPDVAARLVEVLSHTSFAEFLKTRLFEPLGMRDCDFWVPPQKASRLATVYWAENGKLVPLDATHGHPAGGKLVEPDSVNRYTRQHRRTGGSYGLVCTTEDYWRFAQMMLNGGELNGVRILSPSIVNYMTRDHLGNIPIQDDSYFPFRGSGFGMGFGVLKDPVQAGYMGAPGTFFWAGAANTQFWIDPKNDLVVVAMSQHMSVLGADAMWSEIRTLVYSALNEVGR
jgi:CubicO group peptidase (beta-lactamase class C family)